MLDFFSKVRKTIIGSLKPILYLLVAFFLILVIIEINPLSKSADTLLFDAVSKYTHSKTEYKKVSIVTIDEKSRSTGLVDNSKIVLDILKEKPKEVYFLTEGKGLGECFELVKNVNYILTDNQVHENCLPFIAKYKKNFYFHSQLREASPISDLVVDTNKVHHINKKIPLLDIKTKLVGKNLTYTEAKKINSKMNLSSDSIPMFSYVFIENKKLFQDKISKRVVFIDNVSRSKSRNALHLAKVYSASEDGKILKLAKGWAYYAFLFLLYIQIGIAIYYSSFVIGTLLIGLGCLEVLLASYVSIKLLSQKAPFANGYFVMALSIILFQVFKRRKIEKEIKSIAKLIHHNGDWGLQSKNKTAFDIEDAIGNIKSSLSLSSIIVLNKSKNKIKIVFESSDFGPENIIEVVGLSSLRFFRKEVAIDGVAMECFVFSPLSRGKANAIVLSRELGSHANVLSKSFIEKISLNILEKINTENGEDDSPINMADSKQFGYTMGSIKRLLRLNRELRLSLNSVSIPKATYNIFTENVYKNNEFIEILSSFGPGVAQKSIIDVLLKITNQSKEEILLSYNRLIETERKVEFYGEIESVSYSGEKEVTTVRAVIKMIESKGFSIKNTIDRSISLELYPDKKSNLISIGRSQSGDQVEKPDNKQAMQKENRQTLVSETVSNEASDLFGNKKDVADLLKHFVTHAQEYLDKKEVTLQQEGKPFEANVSRPILEFFEALWQNICTDVKPLTSMTIEVSENQKIQGLRVMYSSMGAFDLNTMINSSPFYSQQCIFLKENGIRLLQTKTGDSVEFYIIKNISNSQQMAS